MISITYKRHFFESKLFKETSFLLLIKLTSEKVYNYHQGVFLNHQKHPVSSFNNSTEINRQTIFILLGVCSSFDAKYAALDFITFQMFHSSIQILF